MRLEFVRDALVLEPSGPVTMILVLLSTACIFNLLAPSAIPPQGRASWWHSWLHWAARFSARQARALSLAGLVLGVAAGFALDRGQPALSMGLGFVGYLLPQRIVRRSRELYREHLCGELLDVVSLLRLLLDRHPLESIQDVATLLAGDVPRALGRATQRVAAGADCRVAFDCELSRLAAPELAEFRAVLHRICQAPQTAARTLEVYEQKLLAARLDQRQVALQRSLSRTMSALTTVLLASLIVLSVVASLR